MRRLAALFLILPMPAAEAPRAAPAEVRLSWERVPLDAERPDRRTLGRLRFLGGWALRSRDRRVGGISAMHVEGGMITALTDEGWLLSVVAPGDSGTGTARLRPLPAGPGASPSKANRDSESLVVHGGEAWIGFERTNAIWRYRWPAMTPLGSAAPAGMRRWPLNEGPEAMLRLTDGRFLVFSENRRRHDRATEVLLFAGDPALAATPSASLGYRAPAGYLPTDAAALPDGRMLVLNRRYVPVEGVSAQLALAQPRSLAVGTVTSGKTIASFRPPVATDNFEALAVTREGARTIVWIASDDNFSPLQRTLLLKFALEG